MRRLALALAVLLALPIATPAPAFAQGTTTTDSARPKRSRGTSARPKREPTAGQLAARERMRTCGAEWREAKAKGTTGGLKWPQYFSRCNARRKAAHA